MTFRFALIFVCLLMVSNEQPKKKTLLEWIEPRGATCSSLWHGGGKLSFSERGSSWGNCGAANDPEDVGKWLMVKKRKTCFLWDSRWAVYAGVITWDMQFKVQISYDYVLILFHKFNGPLRKRKIDDDIT